MCGTSYLSRPSIFVSWQLYNRSSARNSNSMFSIFLIGLYDKSTLRRRVNWDDITVMLGNTAHHEDRVSDGPRAALGRHWSEDMKTMFTVDRFSIREMSMFRRSISTICSGWSSTPSSCSLACWLLTSSCVSLTIVLTCDVGSWISTTKRSVVSCHDWLADSRILLMPTNSSTIDVDCVWLHVCRRVSFQYHPRQTRTSEREWRVTPRLRRSESSSSTTMTLTLSISSNCSPPFAASNRP